MGEFLLRFVIGGVVVSLLAALGDVFKPKSFAGLFGAAPSVALATLALTAISKGVTYSGIEARSMCLGAVALGAYAFVGAFFVKKLQLQALPAMLAAMPIWFMAVLILYFALLAGKN
ncbi:MAG TPA: DUF3147 family protein [Fimbriimonadaceae bacterium]|jgi:hypothetical protein